MIAGIDDFNKVFFIGVAGTGMSAIAQYLAPLRECRQDDQFQFGLIANQRLRNRNHPYNRGLDPWRWIECGRRHDEHQFHPIAPLQHHR